MLCQYIIMYMYNTSYRKCVYYHYWADIAHSEHRDQKVAGSSSSQSRECSRKTIFSLWSTFCADSSYGIRSFPCYRSSTLKIPVILPNVQVAGYTAKHTHAPYRLCAFAGPAWSDVTDGAWLYW